jgi:hypothetical protein
MDGMFGGGRGFFGSLGSDLDNMFAAMHDDMFKVFEENMRTVNSILHTDMPKELVCAIRCPVSILLPPIKHLSLRHEVHIFLPRS